MKLVVVICLIVSVLTSSFSRSWAQEAIELTDKNFVDVVYQKPTFVKFYSPYCGHCQKLAPTWEAAAATIHKQHPNVQLVSLDCTKYGDICNKFSVRGYPTIKYVRPSENDDELAKYSQQPADPSNALTRWVYGYENSARTVLAFEQFVNDASRWSNSPRTDFPMELPVHPEILNVLSREQRVSAIVEKAELTTNQAPSTKSDETVGDVGASYEPSSTQSNLLHDALWLVVGLLVVAVAYWVYLTLKVNGKLSKFT